MKNQAIYILAGLWSVGFLMPPGCVGEQDSLLRDVLRGLEKAVDFFTEDYSAINADGLFGFNVARGTVIQSLARCSGKCPDWLVHRLRRLNHTIGETVSLALPYVQSQDEKYYEMFHKTIDSPYLIEARQMALDGESVEAGTGQRYNERLGDQCFARLMGTLDERTAPCSVTDECLAMMTQPDRSRYSITHQLLYFIFAENANCTAAVDTELTARGKGSVQAIERQLCSHILDEARQEDSTGSIKAVYQDLFLEQSMLCGVIGFTEFLQPAWMRLVLSWQTWRGCFTYSPPLEDRHKSGDVLLKRLREEAREIDSQPSISHRKLLREQIMEGNCYSHKTGLGSGLLGVYQRHLIQTGRW